MYGIGLHGLLSPRYCLRERARFGFSIEDPNRIDRVYDWVRLHFEAEVNKLGDELNPEGEWSLDIINDNVELLQAFRQGLLADLKFQQQIAPDSGY